MLRRLAIVALAASCASCAGLSDFLAQPLDGSPPLPQAEGVEIELPDGAGSVEYTPPAPKPVPTVGDAVGQTAGNVLGMLLGNPALGLLLGAGGIAAAGAVAGRGKPSA